MRDGRRPVGGDTSRSPRQFAPPPTKVCLSRGWPITIGSGFPVTVGISTCFAPTSGLSRVMERCSLPRDVSGVQAYRRSDVRVATPDPRLFGTTVSRSWVRLWRSNRRSSRWKVDPRGLNVYSCTSTLR